VPSLSRSNCIDCCPTRNDEIQWVAASCWGGISKISRWKASQALHRSPGAVVVTKTFCCSLGTLLLPSDRFSPHIPFVRYRSSTMGWQQDKVSLSWSLGTYSNALYFNALVRQNIPPGNLQAIINIAMPLWSAKNRPYPLLPEYSLAGRHVQANTHYPAHDFHFGQSDVCHPCFKCT
jgi:hypothetical protein